MNTRTRYLILVLALFIGLPIYLYYQNVSDGKTPSPSEVGVPSKAGVVKRTSHTKPPLLIGCIKCGVSNIRSALKTSGINFAFDKIGSPETGIAAWKLLADKKLKDKVGPVAHVVRHPLSVVTSVLQEGFTSEKGDNKEAANLKFLQQFDPQFPSSGSKIEQALYHWVTWNELILETFPDAFITYAEDTDMPILLNHFGYPNVEVKPWNYPRSFEPYNHVTNITWKKVATEASQELISRVHSLKAKFFYSKYPPMKVNALHFKCEDQTHFLVNFMSVMPYSAERPFRFRFTNKLDHYGIFRSKKIPPHSVLYLIAFEKKWPDFIEIGEKNPGLVVQIHKDEYCTFESRDIPNTSLLYHAFYDYKISGEQGLLWTPLGVRHIYPRVYPYEILPATERPFAFSLIVSLSTGESRAQLARIARSIDLPSYIHTVDEWSANFTGYLGPIEYREKLLASTFTLSPKGHNIECYRMYEACEAGSIPIIEEWAPPPDQPNCQGVLEPFRRSGAPFIYVTDWTTLPEMIHEFMSDKESLLQKQKAVMDWYKRFKTQIITDYENDLAGLWLKD